MTQYWKLYINIVNAEIKHIYHLEGKNVNMSNTLYFLLSLFFFVYDGQIKRNKYYFEMWIYWSIELIICTMSHLDYSTRIIKVLIKYFGVRFILHEAVVTSI